MYHSVIFTDGNNTTVNTWDNWHLIPSSRPVVARPGVNFKFVDIPGRTGSLDLTDYLTSTPTKTDASGSWEFKIANEFFDGNNYGDFHTRETIVAGFLNGRRMKAVLEDEPAFYYMGRFVLSNWLSGDDYSTATIDYRVDPYKYRVSDDERVSL